VERETVENVRTIRRVPVRRTFPGKFYNVEKDAVRRDYRSVPNQYGGFTTGFVDTPGKIRTVQQGQPVDIINYIDVIEEGPRIVRRVTPAVVSKVVPLSYQPTIFFPTPNQQDSTPNQQASNRFTSVPVPAVSPSPISNAVTRTVAVPVQPQPQSVIINNNPTRAAFQQPSKVPIVDQAPNNFAQSTQSSPVNSIPQSQVAYSIYSNQEPITNRSQVSSAQDLTPTQFLDTPSSGFARTSMPPSLLVGATHNDAAPTTAETIRITKVDNPKTKYGQTTTAQVDLTSPMNVRLRTDNGISVNLTRPVAQKKMITP